MDGVSSAFAVVSLSIQLVETGEKISQFLTSVQDAPSEVIKLGQNLDQLNTTLKQVSYLLEQQYLILRLPGSPVFITNALGICERRIKTLEDVIQRVKNSMDHRNRVQRSWAAIKFVSKKEDIQEMQSQLHDAEAGLQTAMLTNSWQLQMHHISLSSSGGLQAATIEESSLAAPTKYVPRIERVQDPPSPRKAAFRDIAKETHLVWYRGVFGCVNFQTKSTPLSRSKTRRPGMKTISNESIIKITPGLLRTTFELRFLNSFGKISRTLSTYSVLEDRAPIFETCRTGNLEGLQAALSSGLSPFVVNKSGGSLLHYAAIHCQLEICALLLDVGVNPNHMCLDGHKAIIYLGSIEWSGNRTADTLRLLTQSKNDLSLWDLSEFWASFIGPVEVAEFMLSQDLIPVDSDVSDGEYPFSPLAVALGPYGAGLLEWERFLRLILRKIVDLHSAVPRIRDLDGRYFSVNVPCKISEYGTPLDELFGKTQTPFEGEAAGDRWLQILSSEGFDVMAYLEEEQALHAAQMQLTYPSIVFNNYDTPRQLIYQWGSNPSVTWDWWIDPNSSTYLVRKELRHMNLHNLVNSLPWNWEDEWPLGYPAWSDHYAYSVDGFTYRIRDPLYERAQERANRRMQKKSMKTARAQGWEKRDQMPGTWPV